LIDRCYSSNTKEGLELVKIIETNYLCYARYKSFLREKAREENKELLNKIRTENIDWKPENIVLGK
jgi:hypothetical protein